MKSLLALRLARCKRDRYYRIAEEWADAAKLIALCWDDSPVEREGFGLGMNDVNVRRGRESLGFMDYRP